MRTKSIMLATSAAVTLLALIATQGQRPGLRVSAVASRETG